MIRNHRISNRDDLIDSRDVIARLDELTADRDALTDAIAELRDASGALLVDADDPESLSTQSAALDNALAAFADWEDADEYAALTALQDEAEGYAADWHHGEALIRNSYFEEYARQLAEDIGAIDNAATWPNTCIDWEQAAKQLQQDYTAVDFDGVTYWVRS